ncbi:MAG TPA: sigma-54 dependent transcriptional regulator [Gammaproteobacteria bacterium]|nr:sigma-54 dependent transcriptional regulator [Gammaproteobacteria bacterium]
MAKVLVADDERAICEAFGALLRSAGHTPIVAASGEDALRLIAAERPDVVFLDVQMPGLSGLETLERIRAVDADLPVIVMTAYGTLQTAMTALKAGAFDYLGKPIELTRARDVLARALHKPAPDAPGRPLREPAGTMVGTSAAMQEIFKRMSLLTTNELTVLITGESGVGKELVARGIHAHSGREAQPFVAVNCAAIPASLIESEFFGHERGAFTDAREQRVGRFEAAGRGTLFLDEISELPYTLQSKLLRVLQERSFERVGSQTPLPFRARLIAATNRVLKDEVTTGRFREDLYHRLDLVTLEIPPLRTRKEDIAALALQFLDRANAELGKAVQGLEPAAIERLLAHDWPGNVRELEHAIKRAVLMARRPWLAAHDLDLAPAIAAGDTDARFGAAVREALTARLATAGGADDSAYQTLLGLAEQQLVAEALRLTNGNQVAAARLLGINRTTLRSKMRGAEPEST